jgi:outer membrane protein assembly factor BamB
MWSDKYVDQPIYQGKGGQLVNFVNLLFYILPNNKVGSIDFNLGTVHTSAYNEIELISSINNTEDKIHIFENYLVYLDEGKYLYTFDIFTNEFIIIKNNIFSSQSKIFFNNSLILKEGNYLQAINIENGKTFWLIDDKNLSNKSIILAIRNINKNIEIFLDNGDVININNKKLIEIKNLNIGKIKSIIFDKNNIIAITKNENLVIF